MVLPLLLQWPWLLNTMYCTITVLEVLEQVTRKEMLVREVDTIPITSFMPRQWQLQPWLPQGPMGRDKALLTATRLPSLHHQEEILSILTIHIILHYSIILFRSPQLEAHQLMEEATTEAYHLRPHSHTILVLR